MKLLQSTLKNASGLNYATFCPICDKQIFIFDYDVMRISGGEKVKIKCCECGKIFQKTANPISLY